MRDEHVERAGLGAHRADALHRRLAGGRVAVDLDQQHRAGAGVDAHAAVAHRLEGGRVEQLEAAGDEAGSDHGGDGATTGGHVVEQGEQGGHGGGSGDEAQRGLGGHRERALAADEERGHVVACHALHRATAGAQAGAVDQEHVEAEHVVAGDTVFEGAGAAGVLGDVAAEGADLERVGIGWIEEALGLDGGVEVGEEDARLDHGELLVAIDLLDGLHPESAEDDAPGDRYRAA